MNARAQWCLLARVKLLAGKVGEVGEVRGGKVVRVRWRKMFGVDVGLSYFSFLFVVDLGRLVGVAASA